MRRSTFIALLMAALLILTAAVAIASQVSGAIWTTDVDGTVNRNIYYSKCDVYLNGGPANKNAPGLPPGNYYYKVTDPSGSIDLSENVKPLTDRMVTIGANGWIDQIAQLCDFEDTPNAGGEYKVWLTSVENYNANSGFNPDDCKTDNFKVKEIVPPLFGYIGGFKYYDVNMNGEWDWATEVTIPGWLIELYDEEGDLYASVYTDPSGSYRFTGLPGGIYTVKEAMPLGNWQQTGPKDSEEDMDPNPNVAVTALDGVYTVDLLGDGAYTESIHFGNICYTPGTGGYTLGFWSNKNGQKILTSYDPAWRNALNALCLKDLVGDDYDVPVGPVAGAYSDFRNWILCANAVNMSYMLSAQLAATKLDTLYMGLDSGSNALLTPALAACYGSPVANIGQVIAEADAALCSGESRSKQECLKNILDGINNNLFVFINSEPCEVVYPVVD